MPTPADIERAATRVAGALDGVLRNCPSAYAVIGTPDKRCVGVSGDVETVRELIAAQLSGDLLGVWRSRDDQRTVFNWLKMPSGSVYLRIASDAAGGTAPRSLIYLDAPTVPSAAVTTQVAAPPPTATQSAAAQSATIQPKITASAAVQSPVSATFQAASPSASGSVPAAIPFTRSLKTHRAAPVGAGCAGRAAPPSRPDAGLCDRPNRRLLRPPDGQGGARFSGGQYAHADWQP